MAYLLVTKGEAGIDSMPPEEAARVRVEEQRESAAIVGVEEVEFLDHPDGAIRYGLDLRRDIAAAIRRHRPEVVVAVNHRETYGGRYLNMADHRWTGLATIDAVRDAGNRWVFTDLAESGLEAWHGVRHLAVVASPEPTHAVDVTDSFDLGVASLPRSSCLPGGNRQPGPGGVPPRRRRGRRRPVRRAAGGHLRAAAGSERYSARDSSSTRCCHPATMAAKWAGL